MRSRTLFFWLIFSLLVGSALLISDRSGYRLPERGSVSLEQVRVLTPSAMLVDRDSPISQHILESSISRPGAWDDPTLLGLISLQCVLGILLLRLIRFKGLGPR